MSGRPYRLLITDDPALTLRQVLEAGDVTYHRTMISAANAFVKAEGRYRTIVYDDCCEARHLTADEERLLAAVCAKLGYDVQEVGS